MNEDLELRKTIFDILREKLSKAENTDRTPPIRGADLGTELKSRNIALSSGAKLKQFLKDHCSDFAVVAVTHGGDFYVYMIDPWRAFNLPSTTIFIEVQPDETPSLSLIHGQYCIRPMKPSDLVGIVNSYYDTLAPGPREKISPFLEFSQNSWNAWVEDLKRLDDESRRDFWAQRADTTKSVFASRCKEKNLSRLTDRLWENLKATKRKPPIIEDPRHELHKALMEISSTMTEDELSKVLVPLSAIIRSKRNDRK
jgi:hypothetical protein